MIYEFRTYEPTPGNYVALHKHLEIAGGLFKKYGLGVLGFWTEEIGTAFQVDYMWVYENIEERQKKLAAFGSDPAWRKQVTEEAERYGVVVARTHNVMLTATPYCPEVRMAGNVQELRIYDAMPGKLPELHNRFANHLIRLFKKHGMESIGYWTETFGTSNRLVYMLGYPSLGDREKSWAAFSADPERQRTLAEAGGDMMWRISNRVLRPTAYSPIG